MEINFTPSDPNPNNPTVVQNLNYINEWYEKNINFTLPLDQYNFKNLSHHELISLISGQKITNYIKKRQKVKP